MRFQCLEQRFPNVKIRRHLATFHVIKPAMARLDDPQIAE
jgi:hypothetical protein